uniref:RNase H type-1 domain-containing protein n=1 Tax=Fagus sylvatica TaxID=28930 RepID=A0A2N9F5C6_FAGSY
MASHELLPRLVANGGQSSCHDYYFGDQSMSSELHWRLSILKAKGLILSGLSWRVGDGAQIPIKGSNWLLEEGHRRILSPLTNLPVDARVGELIHGSPPTWNIHKIQSLFLPYDVDAILKIPLSGRQQEDRLYWFDTQNGKYSVRSGYKLLCKDARAHIPESSRQWDPDPLWKRIWRARVPAKIKTFLWRACHDSLPTKSGLFKRQVTSNPFCDTCREQSEDSLHALWNCPAVSQVWSLAPEFSDLQKLAPMSLSDLMRQVIQSNSNLLFEKFAITSWLLWHKRNQDRLRLPSDPHSQILPRAHALLSEYLAVTTENKPQKPQPPQVRWKPPSSNLFKVNFDGAIFRDSNTGGLGVVIRDNTGMVIATLSQKVTGNHTVEMIEALAARRAIRFAMEVGVTNAEFEGDAETVIRDLCRTDPIYTPYGLVIEDAKVMLAEIQNFSLSHTRRSGNSVAHALARRASKCNSYLVWMEEVPPDITHVLLNDLSALAVE